MSRVICINSKNRPNEVGLSYWIEEGKEYTVINEFIDMLGIPLYQLAEVDITLSGTQYKVYATYRFAPIENVNKVVKQYQEVDA